MIRALALCLALWAGGASAEPAPAIDAMRDGGAVIFLRHAATNQDEIDTGRLYDRPGQRNLSEAGRRQARALGEAFAALDIRFTRILASPVYRATDTAALAFGEGGFEISMEIVADEYAGAALGAMLRATDRLLSETPPAGENLLLVGHRIPLQMVTGDPFPDARLPEGAMAVFRTEGGARRLVGIVTADALFAAAGVVVE
ncbi:histidine phosphatase family protein [Acuticoccus kandeliae]|uniref:histidine phosphatase family protein n=1 Tax=Acuticoccus kandeliae TaxID=2073160 RepID=UPI000D3E5D4E|nr:histidine phosphatase family protein [Acuticoccus kandeliae]